MPNNYYQMMEEMIALKEAGKFNARYIDEIVATISETTDKFGDMDIERQRQERENMTHEFHEKLGIYAIPAWAWLKPFAEQLKDKKVLEFGAGTGLTTVALHRLGVDIDAVDSRPKEWWHIPCLLEDIIICDGLKFIEEHGDEYDVLFIAWPYMNDVCRQACKAFMANGETKEIFYLGEPQLWENSCGCTANMEFFAEFEIEEVKEAQYRPLWGLYDNLFRAYPKRGA